MKGRKRTREIRVLVEFTTRSDIMRLSCFDCTISHLAFCHPLTSISLKYKFIYLICFSISLSTIRSICVKGRDSFGIRHFYFHFMSLFQIRRNVASVLEGFLVSFRFRFVFSFRCVLHSGDCLIAIFVKNRCRQFKKAYTGAAR